MLGWLQEPYRRSPAANNSAAFLHMWHPWNRNSALMQTRCDMCRSEGKEKEKKHKHKEKEKSKEKEKEKEREPERDREKDRDRERDREREREQEKEREREEDKQRDRERERERARDRDRDRREKSPAKDRRDRSSDRDARRAPSKYEERGRDRALSSDRNRSAPALSTCTSIPSSCQVLAYMCRPPSSIAAAIWLPLLQFLMTDDMGRLVTVPVRKPNLVCVCFPGCPKGNGRKSGKGRSRGTC